MRDLQCFDYYFFFLSQQEKNKDKDKRFRPLYDIPYMFEAREFMRKKLIGKKVQSAHLPRASGRRPPGGDGKRPMSSSAARN